MQITCPNCGEQISSENINMQHMTAACPECSTVFRFELPEEKIKRRKAKQPPYLVVQETDEGLDLSFRTNFRLDRSEAFIITSMMSVVLTFVTLLTLGGYLASDVPLVMGLGFGLMTLFLYYLLGLITYNKTHIDINDETIHISRQPLPALFSQAHTINLSGIEHIRYDEAPVSKREGYNTPRYNVWAEMVDGGRKIIVNDIVDDYAVFITQRINEHLDMELPSDISRLVAGDDLMDKGQLPDESNPLSKRDHRYS